MPYRGPCKICVTNNNLLFTLHERVLLHSIQEAGIALAERVFVGWLMSKFTSQENHALPTRLIVVSHPTQPLGSTLPSA
jgi:hypothetical protein